jgi:hypothetical protein
MFTVGAPSGGARVLEVPRKARRRRSLPDAEDLESDREVSPSSYRRCLLNVVRSSPVSAANVEPSVSLSTISCMSSRTVKLKIVGGLRTAKRKFVY